MISLFDIVPYGGSAAKSWEELTYQVRPRDTSVFETRKTKAPDGGVEWYDIYSDGHQEGYQGKFYKNLSTAIGDMGRSVQTVAADRPDMTVLTFVVPFDFTDTGGKSKSDQDRWTEAQDRWKETIPGASRLTFRIIRGGDVLAELARSEHAGRRAFWFGEVEVSDSWLVQLLATARQIAGDRYTPEAHTDTSAEEVVHGLAVASTFTAELSTRLTRLSAALKTASWSSRIPAINDLDASIDQLATLRSRFEAWSTDVRKILSSIRVNLPKRPPATGPFGYSAELASTELEASLQAAEEYLAGPATGAADSRELGLYGDAGQGKTHALIHLADHLLREGRTVVTIMGESVGATGWWAGVKEQLRADVSLDIFLSALSAKAEASDGQGLIIIDGLNESQDAKRWRSDLPLLRAQLAKHSNLSLLVSWRTDYRRVISPPADFPTFRHRGFSNNEREAIRNYAHHFQIDTPDHLSVDADFSNPLLLKLYCEVWAHSPNLRGADTSQSGIFSSFIEMRLAQIGDKLELSPSRSRVIRDGLNTFCDVLLGSRSRYAEREKVEGLVDALLPERNIWPSTLFASLVSAGLLEVQPRYGSDEVVSLPFQAFSEFVLCRRLLDNLQTSAPTPEMLNLALKDRRELWRPAATLLPELFALELIDTLAITSTDPEYSELREQTLRSFAERSMYAFSARSRDLLEPYLRNPAAPDELSYIAGDILIALSVRPNHAANAEWVHGVLCGIPMATRDASFGIMTYLLLEESDSFVRLLSWANESEIERSSEHRRLAAIVLLWMGSSSNRALRDVSLRALVNVAYKYLDELAKLVEEFMNVDDHYVLQRLAAAVYGSLLRAKLTHAPKSLATSVVSWLDNGMPVDVLVRDSLRGAAHALSESGALESADAARFDPPYTSAPPTEPDTAEVLSQRHADADANNELQASTIMHSCLDEWGDFNKYVVRSDVGSFSWSPLSGPPPASHDDQVDGDWAGRWIAQRAVSLGWTADAFDDFEHSVRGSQGREGHKPERFGKKYQWIALHELLARLGDNYHTATRWADSNKQYYGPWEWMGRDIDPSLPPSKAGHDGRFIDLEIDCDYDYFRESGPSLDRHADDRAWVSEQDWPELPMRLVESSGQTSIGVYRYSTWDRPADAALGDWDRRQWFITTAWLVRPSDKEVVLDTIRAKTLRGRWMPERRAITTRYFGERAWSPINQDPLATAAWEPLEHVRGDDSMVLPAVEQYVWEGNVLDCSIDESVDSHKLIDSLLGNVEWDGTRALWTTGGAVVSRVLQARSHPYSGKHSVLLCDEAWLVRRLRELDLVLIIGTLGEKQAIEEKGMRSNTVWCTVSQIASLDPISGFTSESLMVKVEDNYRTSDSRGAVSPGSET